MTFKEYIKKHNLKTYITELDCSSEGLTDLIGIEKFINLTHLSCNNNGLPYETKGLSINEIKLIVKQHNRNKSIDSILS